ncbi:MAG: MBL fold metallo-hydrolase [Candidatus Margulisiibacteriota bacterium]
MTRSRIAAGLAAFILLLPSAAAPKDGQGTTMGTSELNITITVVFDNKAFLKGFGTGYGFACVIDNGKNTVLFDTGCCGKTLLANMKKAGISPKDIDSIVLSHSHWDHTGGLFDLLKENSAVSVHVLPSFSKRFKEEIKNNGAKIKESSASKEMLKGIRTTGELGTKIKEQSLIVDTEKGYVLITGCAHPGLSTILKRAGSLHKGMPCLLLGGFHLYDKKDKELKKLAAELKKMLPGQIAPCHCTGEKASKALKAEFGKDFIRIGAGSIIKL